MAAPVEFGDAVTLAQQFADGLGTFAFAVSGALVAVRKDFDIVGIATLACATAVGGGIVRDVIIGRTPPLVFTDLWYLGIALCAAALIATWHPPRQLALPLDVADAIGLGVFCVTGTLAAIQYGLGAPTAALLGVVTAAGGGVIRDVLAGDVPCVLRPDQEMYVLPAFVGAALAALLVHLGRFTDASGAAAGLTAIGLRLLALQLHWHAPRARPTRRRPELGSGDGA